MAVAPKSARPSRRHKGGPLALSYVDVFRASPHDRIAMIKAGVRATEAKRILGELAFGQGTAFAALKLSAATVNRKAARNQTLSSEESERILGVARLMGQLVSMIEESGRPEGFDAAAGMSNWLREPLPALGGNRPLDLLDTMEGQALVGTTLAQTQSGAYA